MRKKIIACVLALAIAVAFMPTSAFAASKAKMKTYDQVIKSGNTVYCAGAAGIYKVKIKKGKVKDKKLLYEGPKPLGDYGYIGNMKKKGKYIYFLQSAEASGMIRLFRIKTSGQNRQFLADAGEYAIYKNKIYYAVYVDDSDEGYEPKYYKMKLNGKNKKSTKRVVKMTAKRSNARGYSVYVEEHNGYAYDYLKTPKGYFLLGKVKQAEYFEYND